MIVHPTFWTDTRTWRTDCGAEASTVAALLAQFPPGTEVRDYFPAGRPVSADERGFVVNEMRREFELRPKLFDAAWKGRGVPKSKPRKHLVIRPHKYDTNGVLNMWAVGETGKDIAAALGMKCSAVSEIVCYARKCGDLRAVRRMRDREYAHQERAA